MSDTDPMLAGKTVMIVDDEPLLAYDMADLLQAHGASVAATCMSLEEGRRQLGEDDHIDCALLDIQLGKDDVWPLAQDLKDRGIPFLFVSAICGTRELPGEFAGRHCVAKPVDLNRLRDALRATLNL
jgi:CheY-like chemotaxis protein